MHVRSLLCLGLLLSLSCDALFGGFSQPNPKNCMRNTMLCTGGEICDPLTETCVPVRPEADFFAVQTSTHSTEADHVLSGNFDGDEQPDVLLVGQGSTTVLFNVGTSLENRRDIKTNSAPSPFHALATRVNADALDDLVIITESSKTGAMGSFGTIEFCEARGASMSVPFSCGQPQDLKFVPKAVALLDILSTPLPELVALDDTGVVRICRVTDLAGGTGACDTVGQGTGKALSYAQMAVIDDVSGDQQPDIAMLYAVQGEPAKLQILRSAGGNPPTLSFPHSTGIEFAELATGNFLQDGTPCAAVVGSKDGFVKVLPFCDLAKDMLSAMPIVSTDSASLRGDPTTGRSVAVGQFDGAGTRPDDLAIQMANDATVFLLGSPTGLGSATSSTVPFVQQRADRILAAAFTGNARGRSDLFLYNHPLNAGGGRVGLMRSAGVQSSRGLTARATQIIDASSAPPDHRVLSGSFGQAGAHHLALLQNSTAQMTLYVREPTGSFRVQSMASAFAAPDTVLSAATLPCGNGQDVLAVALKNDTRPALVHFRGGPPSTSQLNQEGTIVQLAVADLNGDQLSDLLALRADGKVLAAIAQQPGCMLGELATLLELPTNSAGPPAALAVGDACANCEASPQPRFCV